jgi:hypothetical protein
MIRTRANAQPAIECYLEDELHALHVLTVRDGKIKRITAFLRV